ncbi:MAG: SDR family oxidoreductase [Lachnospiraceae bacterium]|jgi:dTDP-4-dehydrorhamnose reductase|nr:SDR family oxidoreductase [Lachnospiraceae bacterium]
MKYIILGINGMAGHMIAKYLMEQNHFVKGFARNKSPFCDTIIGDAREKKDILNALQAEKFDYIINCIGILNQSVEQNMSDGIYLNSVLPHMIAAQSENTSSKLIHISTDCVFEGTKGQYTEEDIPDALSSYGRTKALGELYDRKNLTIRTSIVGPELKPNGTGLFHWFMSQKKEVYGYEKVIWSGVTTLQLAKAIEMDIKYPQTGLYHLVNNAAISKNELLKLFNQYCRKDKLMILENRDIISDKSLLNTRKCQPFYVPSYDQMVKELIEWMKYHSELYGQYHV